MKLSEIRRRIRQSYVLAAREVCLKCESDMSRGDIAGQSLYACGSCGLVLSDAGLKQAFEG